MLFGLAFGSGYNEAFQSCWGPEASRGVADGGAEPQI
jgi:hypothetical protein